MAAARARRPGAVMKVAVIGGGPGGLYFAALAKERDPARRITVWERNAADDTFGFGVVFSDDTLDGIARADPAVFAAMEAEFARWSDIDIHYRGTVQTSGGHGFAAISRKRLLEILQKRCADLGVEVRHGTTAPPAADLATHHDLVVAADGVNSATRAAHADVFRPALDVRRCRYMWLATDHVFDAFTFLIAETDFGPVQVHAYPYSADRSTFIVEVPEDTWRRAGFADPDLPPGASDEDSVARCADLLGYRLFTNNSRWLRFTTVRNGTWRHGNVVLLGDAAHTAHFSIGSGTKLAMEDAVALADALPDPDRYERERRPVVESTQRAAQASLEWFERIGQSIGQEPEQFAFNLLTRSRRVTYDNLRRRDPAYTAAADAWFARHCGGPDTRPPLFQPLRLRGVELANRVVAAPIATDSATDGVPGDAELLHLTGKALGGAGLVLTGMTAVSPHGRTTPSCPGLHTDAQVRAWRRITDAVHTHTDARIGVQLNHSGRRGPTPVGPSPVPYGSLPVPRELTPDDLDVIADQFAQAARRAAEAGFDVLEVQAGHGFLLSTFLSPLTNHRTDAFGGPLTRRLRFPLAVLDTVRTHWHGPLLARISATDWAPGGTTLEDAVEIARAFAEHGVDVVDVSSGEVVPEQQPAYGRSFQTPFAERIRAEAGVPTLAVGAISTWDDAASIILAGRADLVGIGRAHVHDPAWTLHAAAALGYTGPGARWPRVYAAGETVVRHEPERPARRA
ncbi:bifunctional salicylyl-CoA 5-hydroxylase/oxidoreductase [Saccharothrix mutabilis subsp. mutabilis]|uniref:Bifunctional salicylyl-CoA 5-hydroxylase/oxidoreductase n=2 Tax=Saccharothrix mutabilis TaxID=33921 RepID=A0ABN0TJZ8_9PSEU